MPETKMLKGGTVEEMDARIAEMEEELRDGFGEPLTWDQVTSTTAEEIARREQRRGVLPRLIQAARVKRAELELRDREREAEGIRSNLEPLYGTLQDKEAEMRRAKEERDAAHGEWSLMLSRAQSADDRAKRSRRELEELRGER